MRCQEGGGNWSVINVQEGLRGPTRGEERELRWAKPEWERLRNFIVLPSSKA